VILNYGWGNERVYMETGRPARVAKEWIW